jgi:uncharacterized protein involved in exopolysaccharide biosynthesis
MNIFQFFRILWARRWIVIVATLACVLAGGIAVLVLPRTYSATSRVLLDVAKTDPLNGSGIDATFARAYVPSEAEFMMSNRVASRAADNLGLTRDPQQRADYDAFAASQGNRPDIPSFRNWLGAQIAANITAQQYLATNVIDITYKGSTAQNAAQMANAIRQAYADESISNKRDDATQAVAWLDRQMGELSKQRESAQQRLVQYQKDNGVVLLGASGDADSNELQALTMSAPAVGGTMVGGGGANPNAAAIASLDAKIATESQTLGPNHPIIQDLRKQRAALAAAPTSAAPQYVAGPSHSSLLAQQSAKVLAEQGKVGEAKRLQADVDALTAQYQSMAAREAALRQEMNGNSFSILMLDSASPPDSPSWPKIPLVLIGSLAFGFFAGVLIALIVEFMRRRVRGVEDLVSASNVPVIGVINAPPVALAA